MKYILLAMLFSTPALAKDAIYCKEEGKILNAYVKDESPNCGGSLRLGDACFTGKRQAVIDLINADTFNWGGEEWIADAHFKGSDSIAYTWHDGPNELKEKLSLDRCPKGFFKK